MVSLFDTSLAGIACAHTWGVNTWFPLFCVLTCLRLYFYDEQYVARDPGKSSTVLDKPTYILVSRQGDQQLSNKTSNMALLDGNQTSDENGKVDIYVQIFIW